MLTLIYDNAILYLNETAAVQKYTIYLEHFTMREGGGILNYIKMMKEEGTGTDLEIRMLWEESLLHRRFFCFFYSPLFRLLWRW